MTSAERWAAQIAEDEANAAALPEVAAWLAAHESECEVTDPGDLNCAVCEARCAFCNIDHIPTIHDAHRHVGGTEIEDECAECGVMFCPHDDRKETVYAEGMYYHVDGSTCFLHSTPHPSVELRALWAKYGTSHPDDLHVGGEIPGHFEGDVWVGMWDRETHDLAATLLGLWLTILDGDDAPVYALIAAIDGARD